MPTRFTNGAAPHVLSLPEQTALPTPVADTEQLFAVDVLGITSLRAQSPSGLVTDLQRDSTFVAGNNSGAAIAKGHVVYTTGATNSSYGLPATRLPAIALASAADAGRMPAIGVTLQNIPNAAGGRVMEEGMLTGVDTSAWAAGARLFIGADGLMTNVAPSDRVQRIGIVIRSHATEGQIWVSVKTMFAQGEGTLLPSSGAITTHTLVWNASSSLTNKYEPNPRPAQGFYRYVGPTDPATLGVTLRTGDEWINTAAVTPVNPISVIVADQNSVNANATAGTFADIVGLAFPVVTGRRYRFEAHVPFDAAATTTGSRWTLQGPAATHLHYRHQFSTGSGTWVIQGAASTYGATITSASSSALTGNLMTLQGYIEAAADGLVQVRFASNVANSAITAKAGSSLVVTAL